MSFALYPAYKDSGVPWVHKVPEHWEVQPLLAVMKERNEPNMGMRENNLLSLSYGRIVQKDIDSNDGLLPESFETYQIVRPDDIVFRLTDLQNDKRSLRSAIVGQLGIITSAYVAGHPHGALPAYIHYLFRSYDQSKVFYSMGGGLRQSMKFADLKRMPVLLPPRSEQTTIATFLDRETAKIDALVAEQERLIALLKEKRQAVISHAVTKGLDPSVPMKDSGVKWLGEVPAHWEVRRLRHAVQLNPSKSEVRHLPGKTEVSFLPMEAIGDDGSLDRERSRPISEVESGYTYFRDGDVTIAKITPCFENGKGAVMRDLLGGIGFGTTELIVARPDDAVVSSEYLDRIFNSHPFRRLGEAAMYGAGGQKRVPDDFVRDFAIALPPREEQADIETFLDRETAKIDALVAEQERLIALLKERRSALISAAVTGQIDVRGAPEQAP